MNSMGERSRFNSYHAEPIISDSDEKNMKWDYDSNSRKIEEVG